MQPTHAFDALQYGVDGAHAAFFFVVASFDDGAHAWHAFPTHAGLALSVHAAFTPAAFCDSRHTTQPFVVVLHTGASAVQSLFDAQPVQVPPLQKGFDESVQSALVWHCPHHEPFEPAKQCSPMGQFESFAQPCRHAPVGVQIVAAAHSLLEEQPRHALVDASQCGLAASVQSLLARQAPAASGAQQPPWHDVPASHDELVEQLACVDGHWFAATHSFALHSSPLAHWLELLHDGFFVVPLQPARIPRKQASAPIDRRRAAPTDMKNLRGNFGPGVFPSESFSSQPTVG